MFNNILVPLDGSRQAEATLPFVGFIAKNCHSNVTLLHVVEPRPPIQIHGQHHLASVIEATDYLHDQAITLKDTCSKVTIQVVNGSRGTVADNIVQVVHACGGYDLVALCKHGSVRFPGSMQKCLAQQVSAKVRTPLLVKCVLPRDTNGQHHPQHLTLILEVDGLQSSFNQQAKSLAVACGFQVSLIVLYPEIRALGYPGTGLGSSLIWCVALSNREIEVEAGAYARKCAQEFQQAGLFVQTHVIPYQSVDRISELLHELHTDLAIMQRVDRTSSSPLKGFEISRASHLPTILIPA